MTDKQGTCHATRRHGNATNYLHLDTRKHHWTNIPANTLPDNIHRIRISQWANAAGAMPTPTKEDVTSALRTLMPHPQCDGYPTQWTPTDGLPDTTQQATAEQQYHEWRTQQ